MDIEHHVDATDPDHMVTTWKTRGVTTYSARAEFDIDLYGFLEVARDEEALSPDVWVMLTRYAANPFGRSGGLFEFVSPLGRAAVVDLMARVTDGHYMWQSLQARPFGDRLVGVAVDHPRSWYSPWLRTLEEARVWQEAP